MKYNIQSAATPSTFLAAADGCSTTYRAQILTVAHDIAISVAGGEIETFLDSVAVTKGKQWSFVADHSERIVDAVMPLLDGFMRATILGRWITLKGRDLIEPYAIELIDPSGGAKLRAYDLKIFPDDERPKAGLEVSFTDKNAEQIMSQRMSITEEKMMIDDMLAFVRRRWPIGLFWFSDEGEACLAHHALGHREFSKTRYARIAEELAGPHETASEKTHSQRNASRAP